MAEKMLVMSVDNCTELYENVSLARFVYNVTCLEHAPALTHQVIMSFLDVINQLCHKTGLLTHGLRIHLLCTVKYYAVYRS